MDISVRTGLKEPLFDLSVRTRLKKKPHKNKKKPQKKERERLVDCFKPSILMRGGGGGGGEDGVGMLGHTK